MTLNKHINTGKAYIPLISLIAILAIALIVNLPGIAISPIQNHLTQIFPHASEAKVQLLVQLPNLLIIPFMLLAGWLAIRGNKTILVAVALIIYTAAGVLYMLADSLNQLILISCLLGVGGGLAIPLSTGLLSDLFVGTRRMQQLGLQSGISNAAVVVATLIAGWLARSDWHLPFVVYLISVIPLALCPFISRAFKAVSDPAAQPAEEHVEQAQEERMAHLTAHPNRSGFIFPRLTATMGAYFFATFCLVAVVSYLSFLMGSRGMYYELQGAVTAVFFLSVFLPGFILPMIVRRLRHATIAVCLALMCGGLIWIAFSYSAWMIFVAAVMIGVGYGTYQPLLYDKATESVSNPKKSTLALSFVLSMNYLALSCGPFVMDWIGHDLLHRPATDNVFPFYIAAIVAGIGALMALIAKRNFAFTLNNSYFKRDDSVEAKTKKAEAKPQPDAKN